VRGQQLSGCHRINIIQGHYFVWQLTSLFTQDHCSYLP